MHVLLSALLGCSCLVLLLNSGEPVPLGEFSQPG